MNRASSSLQTQTKGSKEKMGQRRKVGLDQTTATSSSSGGHDLVICFFYQISFVFVNKRGMIADVCDLILSRVKKGKQLNAVTRENEHNVPATQTCRVKGDTNPSDRTSSCFLLMFWLTIPHVNYIKNKSRTRSWNVASSNATFPKQHNVARRGGVGGDAPHTKTSLCNDNVD